MRAHGRLVYALVCLAAVAASTARADPPFGGTINIDPNIILPSDPSTFTTATYTGQANRVVFDRRVNSFITINAYLFNAAFDDGLTSEIQVNPEFGSIAAAGFQANKYALEIGRLPTALRADVDAVWIHQGVQPFGGGNNSILIHTGQADSYAASGILEETLVHEASHTSLDAAHASSPGWIAAQLADPDFISAYARDNPVREDIAESFLPYLAQKYRWNRIPPSLTNTITATIPNRLNYFENQNFNMYPFLPVPEPATVLLVAGLAAAARGFWNRAARVVPTPR